MHAIVKCLNLIGQCEDTKSFCEWSAIQRLLKYRHTVRNVRSACYIDICY